MIEKSNLTDKELVKSLVYTTINKNRESCTDIEIDGRNYLKMGTLQAVTIVGNVYKTFNHQTGMTEYWLFCGIAKQNPCDLKCNKQVALEAAQAHALMNPDMIMKVSKSFGQHTFSDMMRSYVLDMDLEFVKTSKEIKNIG